MFRYRQIYRKVYQMKKLGHGKALTQDLSNALTGGGLYTIYRRRLSAVKKLHGLSAADRLLERLERRQKEVKRQIEAENARIWKQAIRDMPFYKRWWLRLWGKI